MKTLKKTLCLVLAVVMAVGVLILPANADMKTYQGFDDKTEIDPDYELAVATLTGMGIIAGKDNGFDPQGTLLRQEAATLVVNTMLTKTQQTTALLGYESKFVDIDASYAKNAINYLVNKGVVSGKDETHFAPYATLTTYELLTMLRRVAEIKNGYVPGNGDYTTEALAFANAYGLVKTSLTRVFSNPNLTPTREEAAQIIWDTVTYDPVTGGKGYDVYDLNGATTLPANATPVATNVETAELAYWKAILGDDFYFETAGSVANSVAGTVYGLDDGTDTDIYGHVTDTYTNGGTTVYSAFPRVAQHTYDDVFTTKQLLSDLGVAENKTITVKRYVVDGETATPPVNDPVIKSVTGGYTIGSSATVTLGGKGVVTEFFKNDDNSYDVIVRNVYAYELDTDDVVEATSNDPAKIKLPDGLVVETNEYEEGDVVLYTKGVDNSGAAPADVAEVFTPEVVVGYISATNVGSHYARINGTATRYYKSAKYAVNTDDVDSGVFETVGSETEQLAFYLDFSGNVIYVKAYTEGIIPAVYDGYVYVVNYASQNETSASEDTLLGTTTGENKSAVARAQVVDFADGKTKTLELALIKESDGWHFKDYDETAGALLPDGTVHSGSDKALARTGIYRYKEFADGTYCISSVTSMNITVAKGSPVVDGVTGKYANNSTVLHVLTVSTKDGFVDTSKAISHTSVTGYTGFTKIDSNIIGAVAVYGTGATVNIIKEIYIIKTPDAVSTPVNFAVYLGVGETTKDGTSYAFGVDGEEVIYLDKANTYEIGSVYNLEVSGSEIKTGGAATKVAVGDNMVANGKITVLDANLIVSEKASDPCEVADDVVVYIYDASHNTITKGSASDLKTGVSAALYMQKGKAVELVVIYK